MRAIVYDSFGGPERMRLAQRATPVPGSNEVLVRVHASSVNPIDCKLRRGEYRLLARGAFPRIPGADLCGTIEGAGRAVAGDAELGTRVFGLADPLAGGALAEFAVVPFKRLMEAPRGVSDAAAAATPLAGLTALQGLRHGEVKRGDRVLILGASGGVGTFAVQIAKILGAHVTALTSARHLQLSQALGADVALDYARTPAERLSGPFETIFDVVGVLNFARSRDRLAPRGTYVSTLPGVESVGMSLVTAFAGKRARVVVMDANRADLGQLARWLGDKRLKPVIGHAFALDDSVSAHRLSESGRASGKIVIFPHAAADQAPASA